MPHTLLRPKDVAKKIGVSLSHLYQLVASGQFPQPIKLREYNTSSPQTAFITSTGLDSFLAIFSINKAYV